MASAPNNNQHTHAQRGTHNDTSGASKNVVQLSLPSLNPITVQQDTGNEIWDTYLDEVKKDDERIAKAWNDDSTGILVFTGLFSATVGAFIIEFYKQLTPSSNLTITRLENGTYSITGDIPPPLGASIVWVNAMWLISLVLSLTSALMATLLQQWARRYADMPDRPSDPNHRARVRSVLFHGTETYKMRLVVQIAPTLLHLSVYLFFAGLGIVFHTINKSVAIAVYVSVEFLGWPTLH
ncbi:hypothetical protein BJV77DRAFT_1130764 [Russula vinacea]|nr:hypothetical protein BJV77DRAFT_1130764 [Russula vinacea]